MRRKILLATLYTCFAVVLNAQKISNVHFEQDGKKIDIYFDLESAGNYDVNIFCSEDSGKSWGNALVYVTGDVGKNQKDGTNKLIIWDVLKEREKLSGNIEFKIVASLKNIFTDPRDGQTYKTVVIGSQTWFAQNLTYKTSNSWCYDYYGSNCDIYGRLYTWNAAKTACPPSWHLPSDDEWKQLEMSLGMIQSEANKDNGRGKDEGKTMKSTSGWYNNGNGTNSSGFNALSGGYRSGSGSFSSLGNGGGWWSSSERSGAHAWYRRLYYNRGQVRRYNSRKTYGYSVRCLKN